MTDTEAPSTPRPRSVPLEKDRIRILIPCVTIHFCALYEPRLGVDKEPMSYGYGVAVRHAELPADLDLAIARIVPHDSLGRLVNFRARRPPYIVPSPGPGPELHEILMRADASNIRRDSLFNMRTVDLAVSPYSYEAESSHFGRRTHSGYECLAIRLHTAPLARRLAELQQLHFEGLKA